MSLFDDIGRKVTDVGQKTIQKTRDFSDTARFQANISDEKRKLIICILRLEKCMLKNTEMIVKIFLEVW